MAKAPLTPEDDFDGDHVLVAQFQTCQRCDWQGLTQQDQWECPGCHTKWQDVVLQVPSDKVDDFLVAAGTLLGPLIGKK